MANPKPDDKTKSDESAAASEKDAGGASSSNDTPTKLAKDRAELDAKTFALAAEREAHEKQRAALERDRADFDAFTKQREDELNRARKALEKERRALGQAPNVKPGDVYPGPFRVVSGFRYTDFDGSSKKWRAAKDGYVLEAGRIPDGEAQAAWRAGCLEPTAEAKALVPAPPEG